MKLILLVSIFFMSFFNVQPIKSNTLNDKSSYCVMSMKDHSVLESDNSNVIQSVASITKIMTAIIVIENMNLNHKVVIDKNFKPSYGSSIYIKSGDIYTIEDLLYGLMLRSGNDAAEVLAKTTGNTTKNFVNKMNELAKKIGMKNTIFNNPSGLDEEDGGNLSTTYDMALLMSYAMKNKTFKEIVSKKYYRFNNETLWMNKNHFLNDYEFATGGKTGYTKKAGRTLVTTSKKENLEIVVVTFNVINDFEEHLNMHMKMHDMYTLEKILEAGHYRYKNKHVDIEQPYYQIVEKDNKQQIKIYSQWHKYELIIKSSFKNINHKEKYEVHYE